MSWARRLVEIARGQGPSGEEIQSLLAPICVALSHLAAQVSAHSQMAPTAPIEEEFASVGRELGGLSERIATLLSQRQLRVPADSNASAVEAQTSHWGRLVQDLEQLREIRRQLLDAYARLNEVEPALAAELEQCGTHVGSQLNQLRSLIARADPQALN